MREEKQRKRRPHLRACFLAAAIVLGGRSARAEPTKEECFDANESAQSLRASGKLREAQDKLALCAARSCPGPVRKDCTERLDEVQRALPTVVLAVRSAQGGDMTAVRVQMDGAPLVATLGGAAMAIDPGPHTLTFEAEGFAPHQQEILVLEAEKERSVSVVLQPAEERRAAPAPAPEPPAPVQAQGSRPAPVAQGLSTRRWIGLASAGLGLVAVGVGGALALEAKSQFDTAETETGPSRHNDSVSAVNAGNVATVVMGVGGALVACGAVLWLTSPSPSTQVGASASEVFVKGSFW
jgi:hypothetical protein